MSLALTSSIDVAQVVLYVFWLFFAGLIFWIRREDRREGYPLEFDNPARVARVGPIMMASPKVFDTDHGAVRAPNLQRDTRPMSATRTSEMPGSAYEPIGDPLLSQVGAASFAARQDIVEHTLSGQNLVVPLRAAPEAKVFGGADPRGFDLVAADGAVVGQITDVWFDRADVLVRYLEVDLKDGGGARLVPMPLVQLHGDTKKVTTSSLHSHQFVHVPKTKSADRVTVLEEEMIGAMFAGGRLYADPKRLGPVV
jgi:photosynthetic reaction center H subunit